MSMELSKKITKMRNSMEDAKKSEDQGTKIFEVAYNKMKEVSVEHCTIHMYSISGEISIKPAKPKGKK